MRLIKAFGLAAIAATAAMAFVGASPAMATGSTALCNTNTNPCTSPYELLHMQLTAGHVGKLHGTSPTINILCLEVLAEGSVGGSGEPQEVEVSELNFGGCGANSAHNDCEIEAFNLPEEPIEVDVLHEGEGLGTATGLNGVTLVDCEVPFIGHVECEYTGEGLEFELKSAGGEDGHGMLNSEKTELENIGGPGRLCSDTSEIEEGLLEPLTDVYIEEQGPTALCTSHASAACAEGNQVKGLDLTAAKPPLLLNSVANVECEGSSGKATVAALAEAQEVEVTELGWSECHTQGAADNCTVGNQALPTLGVTRTALNVGSASSSGGAVHLECEVLGLFEMDCVYPWPDFLEVEGALHTEAAGNGRLRASKATVELAEGGEHCPETAKWDLSYAPSTEVYVLE